MKLCIVFALAIAVAVNAFAEPFGENYHRTTHCSGTVRDLSGTLAAGVLVSFYSAGIVSGFAEVKTDSNGRYDIIPQFSNASDGPVNPKNTIMARDLERNLAAIEEFIGERTNVDLTLQPAITITGSVKDVRGLPVSNAELDFEFLTSKDHAHFDMQSGIPFESQPIKANEMGSFSISALPQGRDYHIQGIKAKGYGSIFARVEAKDTQTNHYTFPTILVKLANLKLAGRVLDSDGKPVAGAEVRFSGKGQPEWPTTKTDSEGNFVFDAVCEGEVQLSAFAYIGGPPGVGIFMTSGDGTGVKVQGGDTNIVINLLDSSGNRKPLHEATHNGNKSAVELLLASKSDVNAKDNQGVTPLHKTAVGSSKDVAESLRVDMAELLLVNNAEVNVRANNGFTPLHWAALYGHRELAEVLLANGAEVNAMNNNGQTPLHWAIANGRKTVRQPIGMQPQCVARFRAATRKRSRRCSKRILI
jgi:protocatechuate 3,4-dioxygenase beta subunit